MGAATVGEFSRVIDIAVLDGVKTHSTVVPMEYIRDKILAKNVTNFVRIVKDGWVQS